MSDLTMLIETAATLAGRVYDPSLDEEWVLNPHLYLMGDEPPIYEDVDGTTSDGRNSGVTRFSTLRRAIFDAHCEGRMYNLTMRLLLRCTGSGYTLHETTSGDWWAGLSEDERRRSILVPYRAAWEWIVTDVTMFHKVPRLRQAGAGAKRKRKAGVNA